MRFIRKLNAFNERRRVKGTAEAYDRFWTAGFYRLCQEPRLTAVMVHSGRFFLKCFMLMCPKSVFEIALTVEAWQAERAVLEQLFFRCFPEFPALFTKPIIVVNNTTSTLSIKPSKHERRDGFYRRAALLFQRSRSCLCVGCSLWFSSRSIAQTPFCTTILFDDGAEGPYLYCSFFNRYCSVLPFIYS